MLRYFVIATILVVGTLVGVTAYHRYVLHIAVRGGRATMTPRPATNASRSGIAARGLHGDAPWALSALPECLVQTQEWKGTLPWVRSHLPRGARVLPASSELRYADCTIAVGANQVYVRRANDRLRIPPVAHLYAVSSKGGRRDLALIWSSCVRGRCTWVLRVYRPS